MAELAGQIRELQRTEAGAREQWHMYCVAYEAETEDPSVLELDFLQGFVEHYNSGYQLASVASGLRLCLEKSPRLAAAWQTFLKASATPSGQPYEQSEETVVKFLDSLQYAEGRRASEGSGAGRRAQFLTPPPSLGSREPASRSHRPELLGGPRERTHRALPLTSSRKLLIAKVKMMQRELREEWKAQLGGNDLDPAAHEDEILEGFIRSHRPELLEDTVFDELTQKVWRFQGQSDGHAEEWREFVESRGSDIYSPLAHDKGMLQEFVEKNSERIPEPAASRRKESYAPERKLLIAKVKMMQRELGEEWKAQVGDDIDPAAHEDDVLEGFIRSHRPELLEDASKDELILKVWRFQGQSDVQAEEWREFVESRGSKIYSPLAHEKGTLEEFVESIDERIAQREDLTFKVKSFQRSDFDAGEEWKEHCVQSGSQNFDPMRQRIGMLKTFVEERAL